MQDNTCTSVQVGTEIQTSPLAKPWALEGRHLPGVTTFAAAAAAKSLQSCPTLCNPIDGSPSGSPVPGILQARTLEWIAISFSNAWKWKVKVKSLSRVQLLATPWTVAHQAPLSMGFSRQEYWSGVPLPSLTTFSSWCKYFAGPGLHHYQYHNITSSSIIFKLFTHGGMKACWYFWQHNLLPPGECDKDLMTFHSKSAPWPLSPSCSPDTQAYLGGGRRQRTGGCGPGKNTTAAINDCQWQSYWSQVCTGNIVDTDLLSGWSEKDSGGSFHFTRRLLSEKWNWNIFICSLFCYIIYCNLPPPLRPPNPGSMLGRSLFLPVLSGH